MVNNDFENIRDHVQAIYKILHGDSQVNDFIGIDLRIKWIAEYLDDIKSSVSLISKLMVVLIAVQLLSLFIK